MCGIIFILSKSACLKPKCHPFQEKLLARRGPDIYSNILIKEKLYFHGFVLWQQGDYPTLQPAISKNIVLLYNGDNYPVDLNIEKSDTSKLLQLLEAMENDDDLLHIFRHYKGPFSIIFYNIKTNCLYFFRDSFGRNSLLIENTPEQLIISSISYVSDKERVVHEIPSIGIFKINFNNDKGIFYPWKSISNEVSSTLKDFEEIYGNTFEILIPILPNWLQPFSGNRPSYKFSNILQDIGSRRNIFHDFLNNINVSSTVDYLMQFLSKSVKERVDTTPKYCRNCIKNIIKNVGIFEKCNHSKLGILFSGGIDCSILAALANKYVPINEPIELLNVAFENYQNKSSHLNINWEVPDRISSRESLKELQTLFPERKWNLIEINIKREEANKKLNDHIRHLIYPLRTVLDESLGCAFWFAAQGKGFLNEKIYETKCRVLLIGSGADELFGGYTRHRNAYLRTKGDLEEKYKKVEEELQTDWNRISSRNFGRDDRIVSDHGYTLRTPYVEENFSQYVTGLEANQKVCYELLPGLGDKLLLRILGYKLGLCKTSHFTKRAVQFGSKIANRKQNAKDISTFI